MNVFAGYSFLSWGRRCLSRKCLSEFLVWVVVVETPGSFPLLCFDCFGSYPPRKLDSVCSHLNCACQTTQHKAPQVLLVLPIFTMKVYFFYLRVKDRNKTQNVLQFPTHPKEPSLWPSIQRSSTTSCRASRMIFFIILCYGSHCQSLGVAYILLERAWTHYETCFTVPSTFSFSIISEVVQMGLQTNRQHADRWTGGQTNRQIDR